VASNGERREFPEVMQSKGEKMKKLVMSISACMLLAPGFAAAKDTTYLRHFGYRAAES
jgi:hypothetical protein